MAPGLRISTSPPTWLAAPNGDLFVSDRRRNGANNRVVRFTRDGKYLGEWGTKRAGPGQFSEPHTMATFAELYARFSDGQLDAVAEAEYYALDGTVIPSHGPEVVLIDHHDLTPGAREESVFVVRDQSQHLLEAVNAFIAKTRFPL
mgnify:CR=1 FL=1